VREGIFSMLGSLGLVAGARVWDLFAGSGALGIEALSRGAAHATLVDNARPAVLVARSNLASLGYGQERAAVVCSEVLAWVCDWGGDKPDLVLADPPYAWRHWASLLAELAPLAPMVVMQAGEEPALPEGWSVSRSKRYGTTVVTLASPKEGEV
jgi:16S rRNA (guanine966-N2)-methyltransferase